MFSQLFSKSRAWVAITFIALAGVVAPVFAMSNPNPNIFSDDDGSTYFVPQDWLLGIQISDPLYATFGFYFKNAPQTLIGILGPADAAAGNLVLVNFTAGTVFDIDKGALANNFTPSDKPIGFFLRGLNGTTIFSDPSMNPNGYDLVGTFPVASSKGTTAYLIGFELPQVGPIGYQLAVNLQPVPEPATWMMLSLGVLGLLGWARCCHTRI